MVRHALTNILEPIFERRFIPWSFACRKGLGTHKVLALARRACARYACVLKLDVTKYFASIDHRILKDLLARVVRCPDTLRLIEAIVGSSKTQDEALHYFPGDTLFAPLERPRGLPLGNQTSQFFANVKHELIYALQASRYREHIIPLLYKQCDTDALSWTLSSIEWIDFRGDFDEACEQLLRIWQLKYKPG